ncbi:negative regulator of flagellin synthesis FlgM [Natronobacillus azotifigens]|uniref:Negative regulator of flagellin synthesis n=1 Tax=Natronobacillus azotifigens TaxID=472978 RepID=A0A9J6R916_9BACI|nr:flagellar biosynthesis anti-sigma factor FlgM [Natronobacillus azotifigens]MCZ0702120.1 flagellar biosynthesis anti-sigma factor FlgM [Natronobacillus azotifigens]
MKIHGPNHTKVNAYQKQVHKQSPERIKEQSKADQLQISDQAKKMQETQQVQPQREARVEAIKQRVESGKYQIDAGKIAAKMLRFWNK